MKLRPRREEVGTGGILIRRSKSEGRCGWVWVGRRRGLPFSVEEDGELQRREERK